MYQSYGKVSCICQFILEAVNIIMLNMIFKILYTKLKPKFINFRCPKIFTVQICDLYIVYRQPNKIMAYLTFHK